MFAVGAGTALFVAVTLDFPEVKDKIPKTLRFSLLFIGAASGLMSASSWLADEVDHLWLHLVLVAPVVIVLFVLRWFFQKVREESE